MRTEAVRPAVLADPDWISEQGHREPDPWWYRILAAVALAASAGVSVALGILVAWMVA